MTQFSFHVAVQVLTTSKTIKKEEIFSKEKDFKKNGRKIESRSLAVFKVKIFILWAVFFCSESSLDA